MFHREVALRCSEIFECSKTLVCKSAISWWIQEAIHRLGTHYSDCLKQLIRVPLSISLYCSICQSSDKVESSRFLVVHIRVSVHHSKSFLAFETFLRHLKRYKIKVTLAKSWTRLSAIIRPLAPLIIASTAMRGSG